MLFSEDKYRFMFAALQEAEKALEDGEVPVGAVIVRNNRIISRGYNQMERLKDPTAHGEMIAITSACNRLDDWRLTGCSIFVTLEPCIMCTGALLASRIDELYFASFDSKFGACGSLHNLAENSKTNHKIKVYSGIYSKESQDLLKVFFSKKRKSSLKTPKHNLPLLD
jgi:tRNA(adenine34) deaminase